MAGIMYRITIVRLIPAEIAAGLTVVLMVAEVVAMVAEADTVKPTGAFPVKHSHCKMSSGRTSRHSS